MSKLRPAEWWIGVTSDCDTGPEFDLIRAVFGVLVLIGRGQRHQMKKSGIHVVRRVTK
jgi:hypothetical protein